MKSLLLVFALVFSFFSFSQIPNYVPSNGLVGWWPFTGNANDLSVFGNNGTVNGATLTTDRFGASGNAYSFNGISDKIDVQHSASLEIFGSQSASTISVWFYGYINQTSELIGKGHHSSVANYGNKYLAITNDGLSYQYTLYDFSTLNSVRCPDGYFSSSQWYHLVFTRDATLRVYVNGVDLSTATNNSGWTTNYNLVLNNTILSFGCRNNKDNNNVPFQNFFFNGKIDDIGIWNRALTQQEITALYNAASGTVSALNCNGFTQSGNLFSGQAATNVSVSVPYIGGNNGTYGGQTISSTGVTGLTATLISGTLANGNGTVSFAITGTPSAVGNATFAISLGGQSCNLVLPVTTLASQYPANSVFCANGPTAIVDVTNPTTGKTWMDRNLGASQVATSSTDQNAYGDLYQWGRRADGHQCRTSPTTATLSLSSITSNNLFVLTLASPVDWLSTSNDNLWQGNSGVNNPCPSAYRIPTQAELSSERLSWSLPNGSNQAFNSALKLTTGGYRHNGAVFILGSLQNVGLMGYYWSSTIAGVASEGLYFEAGASNTSSGYNRARGLSVRCIKETVGSVGSINCNGTTQTGNLIVNQVATSVSSSVPYTAGNGGVYNAQTLSSTGVTGLTATLNAGALANGNGTLSYTISGTPSTVGTASFAITIGGQSCTLNLVVYGVQPAYPAGTVNCNGNVTIVNDVTNPTTGKTWMDRNLGASQVATSSTDQNAYGDLYQWGRRADGHQCRTSPTTATLSSVDQPAHGNFILSPNAPYDWRSPQNTNLWQGVNGVNNPCPSGYRVPTETELNNERLSWVSNNSSGAFASQLKLTLAGGRDGSNGSLTAVGTDGSYWSSTVSGTSSRNLNFSSGNAAMFGSFRVSALAFRCIKETVGSVGAINCNGTTQTGNLIINQAASSVSISVPYTAGNGGIYNAQTVTSTGVTGLTATLNAGALANGAGSLTYTITGTPTTSGTASFNITIGGQSCTFNLVVYGVQPSYPAGTVNCNGNAIIVNDVTNPTTGKTWMDRNLGASQVATSSTDQNAYGDLYQWGRRADGHQCRTSPTTATLSSVDQPAHGNFILAPNAPFDWRSPQNNNLWQGVNGVNNPCPSGYRVPTETELNNERLSWGQNNNVGAFVSPLKWTMAGNRNGSSGVIGGVGTHGDYWVSSVSSPNSRMLLFGTIDATINDYYRANGFTVRCIKETTGSVGAINCNGTTQSGTLYNNQPASNVTASVPYTGGNGGFYPAQSIASTGVTGLTAAISQGLFANGAGNLSFTISGTPSAVGTATFALNIGGLSCSFTMSVGNLATQYPASSVFCANGPTAIVDVTNPTTGKTWMDRNLGASQVATSSTDAASYGDLYQWGRRADGHQCRTSPTTATLSSVDQPAHGNFILAPNAPNDWRSPQNANLWQGVNGVNNPCPSGYKVPSQTELDNERLSWSSNNGIGAFASTLKWPLAGYRQGNDGVIINIGSSSHSVSSNISATNYLNLLISTVSYIGNSWRSHGCSIRCIKETTGSVGAINCNGTTQSGALYNNQPASNVTASVPYTVGNGGFYPAQSISSTGVTGLTATISQGLFANGAGALSFTISGTPSAVGTATFALNIGGQACSFILNVQSFATLSINTNDTICSGTSTTITANVANAGTSCAAPGLSGTLTNGLVGYWPFCGNANDLSGNANNGTVNGATLTTDRFGVANQAYSFDGVDDYCNLNSQLPNSFSISLWARIDSFKVYNGISSELLSTFNQNFGSSGFVFRTDAIPNKIVSGFWNINGNQIVSKDNIQQFQWNQYLLSYSSGLLKLYFNGIICDSIVGTYVQNNQNVFLAARQVYQGNNPAFFADCALDDIGIWNRALTQQEITQLYNSGQATYSWSPGGATTPSITVSPTQTTTYTCTITMNGATTTQTQTITVNPLPTVSAGANQTICAGTAVTLNGSGATSYTWNNNVQNGVAFTPNNTQTYTVTGTDANGCSNTAQTTVTVNPLPTASITAQGATTFCQNNSVTLNANAGAGLSYQWYNNGTAINAANSATLPVSTSGSYTVQVTNANNCSATSAATPVTVNALPAATITPASATTFCQGGSVVLNANVGQGLSYQWNLNGSPINGANAASYTANATGNYSLDVLNSDGCSATATAVSVIVNALPNVSAGANQTICSGTAVTLSGSGATSYSWNNNVSNGVAFTPASTQIYTVTGTNANGCSNTAQVTVTVNALPTPSISYVGSPILCQGSVLALNATAGSSYLWSNGQTTQSIQATQGGAYTVQVTNANGCVGTSNPVTLTVNPLPAPSITAQGPTTFCQGGSVVLTSTGATSYSWSTNATTQSITVTTSGLYQVTVVDNKGCSGSSAPIQVTVLSPPSATITTIGANALCAGQSTTLSAPAGNTYLWSNGLTTQNITVNAAGTYSVQVTNGAGCSAVSAPVTINVNPVPAATITPNGVTSFCTGGSVVLTASAGSSYLWNNGATTQSITVNNSGSFTVTVTGAGGCNATSAATTVTVNANPSASITPNGPTTFCAGGTLLLSASAGSTYLWSNGATTPSLSVSSSGSYTVTVTNGAGCSSTSSAQTVTVNALPSVSAGNNQTICAGTPVTLSGSGASTYAWNNGVSNGLAFTPASTQTYTVTGTAANGCTNTAQVTVTVNALPSVSAGNNQTICAGTAVTLSGSGAASYSWNNGVNNGVAFTPATTQTYTVTGTNANGCANTAQVTITVNALPTVSAGANQSICTGSQVTLSGSGANTYTWNNGVNNGVAFTPATTQTYTVTGTAANGCTNTAQVTVTVNALPTANVGNNATIDCANNPNGVLLGSAPQVGYQYSWSPALGLSAVNTANPTANPAVTTTYNLNVVETATGCSAAGQVVVTVNTAAPQANAGQSATITCVNNTGGVSLGNTPVAGLTYAWSPSTGLSASTIANPIASPASTTTYTLTVTNASNGCTGTGTVTVTVNTTQPTVNAGPNQSICSGQSVTLTATGANTYTWNNGAIQGVAFNPTTTQTYTVQGTNSANGCQGTAQVTVTVNALPTVSAGQGQTVCAGTAVTLTGSGAASYTWNNGVSNGVAFTPASTQTYTVTGTDANGCSNTAQVTVTVNPLPSVNAGPDQSVCAGTAVTLNGSGANTYTWNNGVSNGVAFTPTTTQTYTVTGTNANGCQNTDQITVTVNVLPTPTVVANGTAPYCPGTNVVMSTTAIAGYTYQWYFGQNIINGAVSASYTATTAGTYTVKVTAPGGCFATSNSVTVSYLNPTITAQGPTSICQGGSVVLQTATGSGFQYTWMKNGMSMMNASNNATFTAMSPGTYSVKIVTPSGCVMYSNPITVSFLVNPTASISASGSLNICAGSSVTLSAANNANAVTYQWRKNGINISGATAQTYVVTQSGTYTVVIANQACPSTSAVVSNSLTVQVFPVPNPIISATATVVTPGVSVTFSTANGVGNTYQWFKLLGTTWLALPGATQSTYTTSSSGTFRVKVTNMYGCWKYSNSITIASSQMPEQGVTCLSDGIHVKHGAAVPLEGTWYEETPVDRTRIAAEWNEGAQEWVLTGKTEGNFVYITLEEEAEMQWMRVADVCGERTLVAYPNPTWNVVYLKGLEAAEKHYELHDVMGRVVAVGNLSSAQNAIDMSNLAPGTYRLVLQGYGVIAIVKE